MQSCWLEHTLKRRGMRHLKHNTTPPLVYIGGVIASKRAGGDDNLIEKKRAKSRAAGKPIPPDLTYKERCCEIIKRNEEEIKKYKTAFDADNLAIVSHGVPIPLNGQKKDCDDMDNLYSFHSVPMGKLWAEVLSDNGYLNDMCPVCGAVKATTFDHYLPQSKYQLFAVHPLNLIPSCTVCNGHKLKNVFDANHQRLYWNAYLDNETKEQFLFCDISEENGMPKVSFRIEQGRLPDRYYEIIKNTFDGLKIADNYRCSSGREISRLKDSCCKFFIKNQGKGLDACIQIVADTIPDTNVNDWANVLDKALIESDIFKHFVAQALKQDYGIDLGLV